MAGLGAEVHAVPVASREVQGVYRTTKRPATRDEIRSALEQILGVTRTCWDGERLIEDLRSRGFDVEDPQGQPIFMDELTAIIRAKGLSIALTTAPGIRRWTFQLVALPLVRA